MLYPEIPVILKDCIIKSPFIFNNQISLVRDVAVIDKLRPFKDSYLRPFLIPQAAPVNYTKQCRLTEGSEGGDVIAGRQRHASAVGHISAAQKKVITVYRTLVYTQRIFPETARII